MKDMEYSYEYKDDDNKYCYPGANVLRNKLGIKDAEMLYDAEREFSTARYAALQVKPISGDFSLKHLQKSTITYFKTFMIGPGVSEPWIFQKELSSALHSI